MTSERCRILALVLVGALAPEARAETKTVHDLGPRIRKLLGDKVAGVVVQAKRAEIFRLEERRQGQRRYPDPRPGVVVVSGYPAVGAARPLDERLFEAFRQAILDVGTYGLRDDPPGVDVVKGCGGFQPGVAVRFWKELGGRSTYVDALLCFQCSDIKVAAAGASARVPIRDMSSASQALLRLASAGLPEDSGLTELFAEREDDRAREALFVSMFPPRTQAVMSTFFHGLPGGSVEDEAKVLARSVPGPELVALASRAFGVRNRGWSENDALGAIAVGAVESVSAADVQAGLQSIATDQVALAGAAALLALRAFDRSLPRPARDAWLPRLAEAAVIQTPAASLCLLATWLRELPGGAGNPLLRRVALGELRAAPRRFAWVRRRPSARGCALLSLAKLDPSLARAQVLAWAPSDPSDQAAARGVLFLTGDTSALDASLFGHHARDVADIVLDHIRARPTRPALEALVKIAGTKPEHPGLIRVEELFSALAGQPFDWWGKSEDDRAAAIADWWGAHAATWTPPPARRPDGGSKPPFGCEPRSMPRLAP